jgi:hypothetical protein
LPEACASIFSVIVIPKPDSLYTSPGLMTD